jgi:hypothetical protein
MDDGRAIKESGMNHHHIEHWMKCVMIGFRRRKRE